MKWSSNHSLLRRGYNDGAIWGMTRYCKVFGADMGFATDRLVYLAHLNTPIMVD